MRGEAPGAFRRCRPYPDVTAAIANVRGDPVKKNNFVRTKTYLATAIPRNSGKPGHRTISFVGTGNRDDDTKSTGKNAWWKRSYPNPEWEALDPKRKKQILERRAQEKAKKRKAGKQSKSSKKKMRQYRRKIKALEAKLNKEKGATSNTDSDDADVSNQFAMRNKKKGRKDE